MPRLALYQPDIPQNTGTMLRLAACLGVPVEIIEPAGFDVSDRNLRRAGMDYLAHAAIGRHDSWPAFDAWRRQAGLRLVLATTKAALPYTEFGFAPTDVILLGRESAGVPDEVHAAADARVVVPLREGLRSLNVAVAAAMLLGEALRQTDAFPSPLRGGVRGGGRDDIKPVQDMSRNSIRGSGKRDEPLPDGAHQVEPPPPLALPRKGEGNTRAGEAGP